MGVQVYENTRITNLSFINNERAEATANGKYSVQTKLVIIATNAYTSNTLKRYHNLYIPLHIYNVFTEPLSPLQLQALNWKSGVGFISLHRIQWSLRFLQDGRVRIGSGVVNYYWDNQLHVLDAPDAYKLLENNLTRFYPSLKGIKIEYRHEGLEEFFKKLFIKSFQKQGIIATTLSTLPFIGRDTVHSNLYYSFGYSGHGIALSNYSGKLLTNLYLDYDRFSKIYAQTLPFGNTSSVPFTLSIPRDPYRTVFFSIYVKFLKFLDWIDDLNLQTAFRLLGYILIFLIFYSFYSFYF